MELERILIIVGAIIWIGLLVKLRDFLYNDPRAKYWGQSAFDMLKRKDWNKDRW